MNYLERFKFEYVVWAVLLYRFVTAPSIGWEVVCGALLILLPVIERLMGDAIKRHEKTAQELEVTKARLSQLENRVASLSLAAGFKRQGG